MIRNQVLVFYRGNLIMQITCLNLSARLLSVWKKPFIRYEPKDVTVSSGEEIRLSCGVMGYPKPTVTWFKDTVPLISLEPRVIIADDTLLIRKARHSEVANDAGLYYCIAKNQHGTYKSRNATVVVHCKYSCVFFITLIAK